MAGLEENTSLDIGMLDNAVIDNLEIVDQIPEEEVKDEKEIKTSEVVKKTEVTEEDINKVVDVLETIEDKTSPDEGKEKDDSNTEDPPATSVYPALAEFLKEKRIISSLEDVSELNEEGFVDLIKKEIEDSKYANLSENQVMYMKALEAGVDEQAVKNTINVIDNVESITEQEIQENKELRTELIREDLKALGWDDRRISKQIERLIQSGDDIDEAFHSKANIITRDKKILEKETQNRVNEEQAFKLKQEKQLQELKSKVYATDKVLDSVKIDGAMKDKVYAAMTTATERLKDGTQVNALTADRLKDPIDFERRLYYTYVLTNGFTDMSSIQRKAENKAARRLREAIQSTGVEMSAAGAGLFKPDLSNMPDIVDVAE